MDGLTTGLAFLAGLGLPQVLLWVLTFAVVFAVLTKAKIFGRAPATLISVVAGIFVLMAVPAALISVIATMSTSLLVLAVGILMFIALIEVSGALWFEKTKDGYTAVGKWYHKHSTAIAVTILILVAIVFYVSGGATLVGIGIPTFGWGTWLLILVGIAVLWMMSESPQKV